MKRLLFSVTGLAAIATITGCGTPTGPFKNANGKALTTASGATIVVVDNPVNEPVPPMDKNANYTARLQAKETVAKKSVQIARAEVESVQQLADLTKASLMAALRKVMSSDDMKGLRDIVTFTDGRAAFTEETLRKAAGRSLSAGEIVALSAMMEDALKDFLEKELYPKMVASMLTKIRPYIEKRVAEGKFAVARELIWRASMRGIPQVDDPVREKCMEMMHGLVNPTNWRELETKIEDSFQKSMKAKAFNEGIAELKKIQDESIVKEYASLVDRKIDAIKVELKAIGVSEADMQPILEKQGALIAEAAKIKDVRDEFLTIEKARKDVREKEARKDPALAEYYKRLDDFHEVLVKHNCTKENADKIVTDLDKDLLALIDLLRKSAVVETNEVGEKKSLQLGTRSLNDRIRTMVADRIKKLEMARDAAKRAAYLAKLNAAKSDLEKKVRELVAAGKFEEARELIWNAAATGDAEWDSDIFALGLSLLRDLVNPKDWERIEADILANFKALSEKGDFVALRKFLETYPLIRQHTVKLDNQLAKVRAEAEALGAKPEAAAVAAKQACDMVTEAEALVDHLDQVIADAAAAGKEIDKSKLQAELKVYAEKLARFHATPANVAKIVEKLQLELDKLIAKPENPKTTHLALGTNAVNDRIRKLCAQLLSTIEKTKHDWEDKEHARVITDLEKRVRKAVKEQRFDDARNYIRDEKLIGRKDLDLSLYELRVGLLDSCVNPAQLDFLLADIDAKMAEFMKNKDFAGALKFIEEYPYVHDQYMQIDAALEAVKQAMIALEISVKESEYDEKVRFFNSIQEILEKRRETWKPDRDLSGVEKALGEVAKALVAHLYKHPELIESERKNDYLHIMADIAALDRTVTTWELNERLRARVTQYVDGAKKALAIQEYGKLLSAIDADVSFDSQISIAEEAISRQLGQKCDKASFKINALLGEYARVFRLMKKGVKISAEQATTILLGGAYLDQAQVVKRALDLGAQIDGTSDRDPRGRTALALAIDAGHSALVKQIVEAGASLTATDKDGNAIVHYAAKSGNLSVLKAVTAGAPVFVKNKVGCTPLSIAVVRNQASVVDFLVGTVDKENRAAFVNSANEKGDTAFDIAATFGSRDVLDSLAKAGAEYGTKDLVIAEKADHIAIAQWLVNQGLDVNAEGVMAAACPRTQTGHYLVNEGGVPENHSCDRCKPAPETKPTGTNAGGDTAKCDCTVHPVPVDVLLVPQHCDKKPAPAKK